MERKPQEHTLEEQLQAYQADLQQLFPVKEFVARCVAQRRPDLAFALLDSYEASNKATLAIYIAFIHGFGRTISRDCEAWAYQVFLRIKKKGLAPSVEAFTAMLATCAHSRHLESVLHHMQEAGVKPTPITYVAIFKAYARFTESVGARPVMERYEQFKRDYGQTKLNRDTTMRVIGSLLVALSHVKDSNVLRDAAVVLTDMVKIGLQPNVHIAHALINIYLTNDNEKEAYNTLDMFSRRGTDCKPNSLVYTSFILFHFRRGEHDRCIKLLQEMVANRVEPTEAALQAFRSISRERQQPEIYQQAHALAQASPAPAAGVTRRE